LSNSPTDGPLRPDPKPGLPGKGWFESRLDLDENPDAPRFGGNGRRDGRIEADSD
jgi:hypothetical protein